MTSSLELLADFADVEVQLPNPAQDRRNGPMNVHHFDWPVYEKKEEKKGRGPRKRHWCFTSYLPVMEVKFDPFKVRYCIYQQEICPLTLRAHWQGYIEFFNNVRRTQVKAVIGECHAEPRMGSRVAARDYCRKKETAVAGTQFEFGLWRQDVNQKRKLSDMLLADMTLDEIVNTSPISFVRYHRGLEKLYSLRQAKKAKAFRNVEVIVLVGPTGCGKTRRAAAEPDHFFMPATTTCLWFDGYKRQKCLVMDDFYGNVKYGLLLRILDGHELQLPIKGGFIWAMWSKVIITSNKHPREWYKAGLTAALARRITSIVEM